MSAPVLDEPTVARNANGSFTVSVEVSENVPASVTALIGSASYTMDTADADLPKTYSVVVSDLAYGTHVASVRAESTSGNESFSYCRTAFHAGALAVTKLSDAVEDSMTPGTFRISRADTDFTGLPALTFNVAFSGDGLAAIADPGISTATIPAGAGSVDISVTPVFTMDVDADADLGLSVSGTNIGMPSTGTLTVFNATFDPAVRYVATTGNDANHGGTPEMPKKTIASALSSLADVAQTQACTIHVADGRYNISTTLSLTQAISLIGNEADPARVVVSNTQEVSWNGGKNRRCITVNHADAMVSSLTLENGKDYDNGGNVRIDTNGGMVTNCILSGGFTREGSDSAGANVAITGPGLVTHCKIFGGWQNNCGGCDRVSSVYLEHANARIENCLVKGFKGATVSAQPTAGCAGILVNKGAAVNCTVADCTSPYTTASGFAGILLWANGRATNCVSVCNVDSNGTVRAFAPSQVSRTSHCAFDAIAGEATIPEGMPNAVVGTAAQFFNDYEHGDYTLNPTSLLVNAGVNYDGMASVDLAGKARRSARIVDIGCYECQMPNGLFIVVR